MKTRTQSPSTTGTYRSPYYHTDAEIAAELGVSPQRVAQIAKEAMRKIRREFERRGIVASDFYDTEGG